MTKTDRTQLGTQVLSIACAPDGQLLRVTRIARGKTSGSINLDAATLKEVDATGAAGTVANIAWTPASTVDASFTSKTKRWTVGEHGRGLFVHTLGGKQEDAPLPFNSATELTVTAFAISADERWAAVGSASGFVNVFNTASGEQRWAARQHKGHVTAACFSPDGQRIYSGNETGELRVADLPD